MKKDLNVDLLYSDTDPLIYKIFTKFLYRNLAEKEELKAFFDSPLYPQKSPQYSTANKKNLLFKDEIRLKVMEEFVGLKPIMY